MIEETIERLLPPMTPAEINRQLVIIEGELRLLEHQEQSIRDELTDRLKPIEIERERLGTEAAILRSLQLEASANV